MKRQRGRGRKPGGGGGGHHNNNHGHQPNRTMESNGPEGKVRGPAAMIHERYLQLARDSYSAGDRVLAENFFQHADHYFRLWRASQPAAPVQQERFANEGEYEGEEESSGEGEAHAAEEARGGQVREARGSDEQPEEGERDPGSQAQPAADGDFRRRRGRRNRFRPGEEAGGEAREPREARETREPREAREPREPREPRETREPREAREARESRDRDDGPEGFSGSPRPAFLRSE